MKIEEKNMFTIPKQYYLGLKTIHGDWDYEKKEYKTPAKKGELSTETYPLGFATPMGTDKAFQKRKSTVDSWADNGTWYRSNGNTPFEGIVFDNVPQKGFKFKDFVSRWTTSNKWFNVLDPRGFHLQLSAAALMDLIEATTVINGVIQDECVWGRRGSENILVPTSSEMYKQSQSFENLSGSYQVGDVIIGQGKGKYIYIGVSYPLEISVISIDTPNSDRRYTYSGLYDINRGGALKTDSSSWFNSRQLTNPDKWHFGQLSSGSKVYTAQSDYSKDMVVSREKILASPLMAPVKLKRTATKLKPVHLYWQVNEDGTPMEIEKYSFPYKDTKSKMKGKKLGTYNGDINVLVNKFNDHKKRNVDTDMSFVAHYPPHPTTYTILYFLSDADRNAFDVEALWKSIPYMVSYDLGEELLTVNNTYNSSRSHQYYKLIINKHYQ